MNITFFPAMTKNNQMMPRFCGISCTLRLHRNTPHDILYVGECVLDLQGGSEPFQDIFFAFSHNLDTAIRQVLNKTGEAHILSQCYNPCPISCLLNSSRNISGQPEYHIIIGL